MDAVDRIFTLLDLKGIEQKAFASAIGTTSSRVSEWKARKSQSFKNYLPKIAEALGTTVDYLLLGEVKTLSTRTQKGVLIPVLGNVAAGIPIEAVENIVDYEEIDSAMASSGEHFGLRLQGISMEPRMREGDVVIVRKQPDADTGDVVVVLVNGQSATVKKLKKGQDGITLIPLNPAFDPMYFSCKEVETLPVSILGRVVELRAKF